MFDWDYHMRLSELVGSFSSYDTHSCINSVFQATIVSSREYQSWREGGVAFQLREDAPYEHSNRTLASGLIMKQVRVVKSLLLHFAHRAHFTLTCSLIS